MTSPLGRLMRSMALPFAGALCLAVLVFASSAHAATGCEDGVSTRAVTFSVVLPDDNKYEIAGFLYWNGQLDGKVLQIAVHGATYNHRYWDADELNGHQYSYARYMACHGFAVLAIDNLGAGASSKPDGDFVTVSVEANALHQIIQGLGAEPVGASFRKVVLVGHSMGSEQVIFEQGKYHDADGLVVTGWENTPQQVGLPPEVLGALASNPYVFIPPWMRTLLFYAGNFDPAMPDYDNERYIDQVPRGVFNYTMSVMAGLASTASEEVQGPVLVVLDEYDMLMSSSLLAGEPATYPKASSVTTHMVYGIGHNLNFHLSNTEEWARIKSWIRDAVEGGAEDYAD